MPALAPWITTQDPPRSSPDSSDGTILANRFDAVLTTSWSKAAARPHHWTDVDLIETNQADHTAHHQTF